jgi:aerobic carbon-monoxide dehydrogenase medium subunit
MKPCAFEYVKPDSIASTIDVLAKTDDARIMAGGQSLIPMMNLRMATPALVVDVGRLSELRGFEEGPDSAAFGACITHAEIEDKNVPDPSRGLMPRVASTLSYRAVRNRGTIGGSLALADPAAEWPAVLTALDGRVTLVGQIGRRSLKINEFICGICQTTLRDRELLERVTVPKLSARARWGYRKFSRKLGAFANSIAVAVHDPERSYTRVVVGAANGPPYVLEQTSKALATDHLNQASLKLRISEDLHALTRERSLDRIQATIHAATIERAVSEVFQ